MIVFWLLIIMLVIAVACVISAVCGDKLYDGTKKFTDIYTKQDKEGDEENVRRKQEI